MLHGTKMRKSWFSTQAKGFDAWCMQKIKIKLWCLYYGLIQLSTQYSTLKQKSKNEDRHFVLSRNRHFKLLFLLCLFFPACFSVTVDLELTLHCFHHFREFSHWKVNSLATEKRDFLKAPLPLAPEFLRNLRLLGRRPTLQQINENLIKKYGTHFLVSATLGGKKWHAGLLICNLYRSRAKKQRSCSLQQLPVREESLSSCASVEVGGVNHLQQGWANFPTGRQQRTGAYWRRENISCTDQKKKNLVQCMLKISYQTVMLTFFSLKCLRI